MHGYPRTRLAEGEKKEGEGFPGFLVSLCVCVSPCMLLQDIQHKTEDTVRYPVSVCVSWRWLCSFASAVQLQEPFFTLVYNAGAKVHRGPRKFHAAMTYPQSFKPGMRALLQPVRFLRQECLLQSFGRSRGSV